VRHPAGPCDGRGHRGVGVKNPDPGPDQVVCSSEFGCGPGSGYDIVGEVYVVVAPRYPCLFRSRSRSRFPSSRGVLWISAGLAEFSTLVDARFRSSGTGRPKAPAHRPSRAPEITHLACYQLWLMRDQTSLSEELNDPKGRALLRPVPPHDPKAPAPVMASLGLETDENPYLGLMRVVGLRTLG
jgi:hypothetical protein